MNDSAMKKSAKIYLPLLYSSFLLKAMFFSIFVYNCCLLGKCLLKIFFVLVASCN